MDPILQQKARQLAQLEAKHGIKLPPGAPFLSMLLRANTVPAPSPRLIVVPKKTNGRQTSSPT